MKRVFNFIKIQSRIVIVVIDSAIIPVSYYLAFIVRKQAFEHFLQTLPVIFLIRLLFFVYFRLYRGSWRYASITDLWNIIRAVFVSEIAFILYMVFIPRLGTYPRAVFILDPAICILLLGSLRFSSRLIREFERSFRKDKAAKRILIIGAGDAGEMIAREMLSTPRISSVPIAFLDDKKEKQGQLIHGIPIFGTIEQIPKAVRDMEIEEIIIAIPSASPRLIKQIVSAGNKARAKVRIVPALRDLIDGRITVAQIREINIEDLLGRDVVSTDIENISRYLENKALLVTGAGGSIGSEICRQTLRFSPSKLVMLDINENTVQEVSSALRHNSKVEIIRVIGSITNQSKLRSIFKKYRPNIVFHAAACKHVDLMEDCADEAVITNIIGTKYVIECAKEFKAERLIVISSDKAADPASVMGCTKRVAEMLIQSELDDSTVICGVRFGNVLGSQGSVVPLFQQQIKQGGPITVTDERMTRYFMTIPEAVELVIQVGAMGRHKGIYMLDMGEPVRIVDLAREMITLSGFKEGDIGIKYTGIRKGEKLEEILIGRNETFVKTLHPKIMTVQFADGNVDRGKMEEQIKSLMTSAIEMDYSKIRAILADIVPEYNPASMQE
jgi:FlaA1/EpsC-like NDP-sugar epimerase